ncbi:threonylcarbamoyl-AMP synthase [Chitinophagaceae bacterium IBVUCB1]|nr:threonylcarbamoyl-AMP synthase [Chitinophagaceae bacterium IBVUCB1]
MIGMVTETGNSIIHAAVLLLKGEIVAIPTETVYGLAANALNEDAVSAVYIAKERPYHNPLIVHLHSIKEIEKYVTDVPPAAHTLLKAFAPGPLTVLLPKKDIVPDIVTAGLPHVAIRIPAHPIAQALLKAVNLPLAAPSANRFSGISPTSVQHVQKHLDGIIPYILDGGMCDDGIESTVVGFENNTVVIYRQGAITEEQIKTALRDGVRVVHKTKTENNIAAAAPGMLHHHYSPDTPLLLTDNIHHCIAQYENEGKKIGTIRFDNIAKGIPLSKQIVLSAKGNMREAARNFYASLHYLDEMGLDVIICEYLPDYGLGKAINDRLKRAAAKHTAQVVQVMA